MIMCFTFDDYDWSASICEIVDKPAEKDCRCEECGELIKAGDQIKSIFMQEEESCQICMEHSDDPGLGPVEPHVCEFGNTWSAVICEGCIKLRESIRQHELAAGCPEWSAVPAWGMMRDELWEHDDRVDYVNAAVASYPELITHPIVASILEDESDDE